MKLNIKKAKETYKAAEEILFTKNKASFGTCKGDVLRISDCYAGIWMEHAYDALIFATLYPNEKEIAVNQAKAFFEKQRSDGQFPAYMRDPNDELNKKNKELHLLSYRHIQECVSFANICFETYKLTNDKIFLKEAYSRLCAWDKWLCDARMTRKEGLIELFCEWDTGHDNALRLAEIPYATEDEFGRKYDESIKMLPIISPGMNAVFYGDRIALSKMAAELNKPQEATQWHRKAVQTKAKIMEKLFDSEDLFFYDLDKNNNFRKFKTIQITQLFQEHILEQELFDKIYDRYFTSEREFATPVPFPSTSASDPSFIKNFSGNSWNYYSQTLTALRAELWMEHYGKKGDYEDLLEKWLCAFTESPVPFGQEFDPFTGKPSDSSPNYSSALLFYIRAMRRLGYMTE